MGLFLDSRAAHKEGDGGADAEGPQCPFLSKPRPPTSVGERGPHPPSLSHYRVQTTCYVCPTR